MDFLLEACVETYVQGVTAAERGAHQLELCADLAQDGLTPDLELTHKLLAAVHIPIKVMIRPRGGDFVFGVTEIEEMSVSIMAFAEIGIHRFVIGMATLGGYLAIDQVNALCRAFPDYDFTLHKVIDQVHDPLAALQVLNDLPNLTGILTSGGATTALAGAAQIQRMQEVLAPGKKIIAAGRITNENLSEVRARIRVPTYHGRRIVGTI